MSRSLPHCSYWIRLWLLLLLSSGCSFDWRDTSAFRGGASADAGGAGGARAGSGGRAADGGPSGAGGSAGDGSQTGLPDGSTSMPDADTTSDAGCATGFTSDPNGDCVDIDECQQPDRGGCSPDARCRNREGDRVCSCEFGFEDTSGDGTECVDQCSAAGCDENARCILVSGEPRCTCRYPYLGDGKDCVFDEACSQVECDPVRGECVVNNGGGRECRCAAGFSGSGTTCTNIDECGQTPGICGPNTVCTDNEGTYDCSCVTGFEPAGSGCSDVAKPIVTVPNVPCGAPTVTPAGAPAQNLVKIGGRDVFVAYPCAQEGAAVTFYLALHGTLQAAQKIPFTLTTFPIHTKVDSDNFIVVVPQAIGTQWGREDDGQDLPHLYEVIDWVYATFGEKFSIRGMWAGGASWGTAYLSNFACDPKLENRLTGIRMIVGGGCPACSTRLSCIVGKQELELGGGVALSDDQKQQQVMAANIEPYAVQHGCDARTGPTDLGPVRAWTWPNCDNGFQHSFYLGSGQHADRWDDPTYVDHMTREMKAADR